MLNNNHILPFIPQATAWPLAPIYTGELSPEFERQLVDANVITGNDMAEFNEAMQKVRERVTHDNIMGLLNRFSYRLYKANPIDNTWASQTDAGSECFSVGNDNMVRRSYAHPFLPSSANDIVLAMDDQDTVTTHSLLTTHATLFYLGDFNQTGRSIYELNFSEDTFNLHTRVTGFSRLYGDRQYISQRHAEHFFDWHRAVASGNSFEYTPEDISVGPYVLFEYVTAKEQKFVQYWDNQSQYLFHQQIYHPDCYKDKTPEQIAELLGYKRLYKCDVVIPPGQWVKAWAGSNSRSEFTYTIDANKARFPNQVRLVPPAVTWEPGQKERYDKARAVWGSGFTDFQPIVDLYDAKIDANNSWWLLQMALVHGDAKGKFYDEEKGYAFMCKSFELNEARAGCNIGIGWMNGYYGKIDLEKAKKWLLEAFNQDDEYAGKILFNLLQKDQRYKDKKDPEFLAQANEIYTRTRKLDGQEGQLIEAQYQMTGFWGQRNPARGIYLYEKLAETTPITMRPPIHALFQLAQRCYLGLDVPRDLTKALEYLDKIPAEKGDNLVPPGTKNGADKLRHLIQVELGTKVEVVFSDPLALDAKKLAEAAAAAQATAKATPQSAARLAPNPAPRPAATAPTQSQPMSDDEARGIMIGFGVAAAAVAGVGYLAWTVRDEVSAAAAGLVVTGGVFKTAHDFEANTFVKATLTTLSAIGAGFCTYLVAKEGLPQGTLVNQFWENHWGITTGLGVVTGSYVLIRDWMKGDLGLGTAIKTTVSGAVVAGSLYMSGFFSQPKQANVEDQINFANAYVATKQINVRSNARAEQGNILGKLACGNGVHTVNGISDEWTEIILPDRTHAFIASRFLSNNQPTTQQCQP
ncbi:MAG: hypothetical protein WAO98_07980 [Alphaproteobacteria bacterium]